VKGTINVLQQAEKAGVEHVVITSSFAAIVDGAKGGPYRDYTYTAKDWNPFTAKDATAPGCPPPGIYATSKKLAEQSAWKFHEEHPSVHITTINPPMIYGPPIQAVSSAADLNTSSAGMYALIQSPKSLPDDRLPLFCDVRDVAYAHVAAISHPGAKNQRVLLCADEPLTWFHATEFLAKERPDLKSRLPPLPSEAPSHGPTAKMDTTLAKTELGIKFIEWKKTLLDTVDALVELEKSWA